MGWQNNKKFIGLWAINENRNVWTYVGGLGWRRLANDNDNIIINFVTLAAHAKGADRNVNFREEGNTIKEMYIW